MLYPNLRVAIPQGKEYKPRTLRGIRYLYYHKNSYRVNGKLKHNEYSLGRVVFDSEHNIECLIPNERYYEHFNKAKPVGEVLKKQGRAKQVQIEERYADLPEESKLCAGYSIAVMHLAKASGLYDILIESFGNEIAHNILAIGMFFAAGCPYGLSSIEKFTEKNICFSDKIIKKNRITDYYSEINAPDITAFFNEWIPKASENDFLCYDVTSVSSYSKKLPKVKPGYNRDKENLAQINIGLFCTLRTAIPLYMTTYNGSINDFTNFPKVIERARNYGIDINKTTFVMDGGFALEKVLSSDIIGNNSFIVGAPLDFGIGSRNYIENWDRTSNDTIIFTHDNDIIEAKEETIKIGTRICKLYMYFSEARRQNEILSIKRNINEMASELDSRKRKFTDKFLSKYQPLFDIEKTNDNKINYKINSAEYRNITSSFGYFAIICSDDKVDIQEALILYRKKDVIEKTFGVLKNGILHERFHVSLDSSLAGKEFIAFIGLIIRRLIENRLKDKMKELDRTYGEVIATLTAIRCRKYQNEWILDDALTKEERIFMESLGVPTNIFKRHVISRVCA